MHKKNNNAVKKQKIGVSGNFTQTMLGSIADKIDLLAKSAPPETPLEARKQLINLYKTLLEVATYYHQVILTPSKDPIVRISEQGVVEGAVDGMEAMTEQALIILQQLNHNLFNS